MLSHLGFRNVFAERFVQALLCLQLVLESVSVCAKRIHLDRGIPRRDGSVLAVCDHTESYCQASNVNMSKALQFFTCMSPTKLAQASPRVKIVTFASIFGAYWLAFPWMLTVWSMPSRIFAVSYIVMAALLWGLKGGLLVALINIPVVIGLLKVLGIENIAPVIAPIITLSLAAIVGRLTDLSLALEARYVRSSQAEQALQTSQQHLEHEVQERMSELAAANQLLQREIAERQRTEAALRSSEERYRHLVENINDVIYATDAQGVFTYLSPAVEAQSGYKPAELVGHVFADYVYQEDRQRLLEQFEKLLAGHLEPSEYRIVTKAGTIRWIRSSSRCVYQGDQVVGVQGAYIDITEKRGLEEQLRQAHKMEALGTLAGGIAHDFNNILGIILGNTELALLDRSDGQPTRGPLEQIHQACLRAQALVRQILSFSRKTTQELQLCHLGPIVQESLTLMRALIPTTIDLRLDMTATADVVLADPAQLQQVVINLVMNAAQAMEYAGGVLEVSLVDVALDELAAQRHDLRPGSYVRLTVRDTGGGIAPAIMGRIFDPYFTTKEVGKGTGLGLAVVHGIVTQHGGAISVHSVLGQGASFQVYLPVRAAEPLLASPLTVSLSAGQERILFIDDEPALASMGKAILEHLGYAVVSETRSPEALILFTRQPDRFDLVITDMTMPGMTGDRLAKELRRIRPDIPIILCSGFSHYLNEEEAKAIGICAFLMKPFVLRELAETVRTVLHKQAE
jgi:PAS domain S-box-containing protein